MRAAGLGLLVLALAFGGEAFADSRPYHSSPVKLCYRGGTAYKPGDFCYTTCAPAAACQLEVCISNGQWMEFSSCKARDCRRVC
jgi:hypothetical protein